jgi:putative hemolysin
MPDGGVEIVIILLLVLANGLLSMSEFAIVSVRRARLQQRANQGDARARAALDLVESSNRFLSTVQIGITLVGIAAGAYGGATLVWALADQIRRVPALAAFSDQIAIVLVVLGITYLTLVFGEIVPKRLALHSPERIASAVAIPMRVLSRVAAPAVFLLSISTDAVLRALGIGPSNEPPVTEEEIKILIDQGIEVGIFEETEREMVEHVFRLADLRITALMTPRTEVVWLDVSDTPEEIRQKIEEEGHTRYPVCQENLDNVLGVVDVKDLALSYLGGKSVDLQAIIHRSLFVPESIRAFRVLEMFKQSGIHIAIVVDEYGSTEGLVTLDDIMKEVVGDVPTLEELAEPLAVRREDGSWILDGMLSVEEFKDIFQVDTLPGETTYQTLGGFIFLQLGSIPSVGTHFEWEGLRFEVMDMDGNRIDKVLVTPVEREPSPEEDRG